MKSNIIKIITVLIIGIIMPLLYGIFNYSVMAETNFDTEPYITGIERDHTTGTNEFSRIGRDIIGILRGAGTVVSVIMIIVIGIKYMMGSVEERADYKKSMMPYLIGAIMVFGIINLLSIIVKIANRI